MELNTGPKSLPELSVSQVDAMNCIFDLCDAIEKGGLSIASLQQVMSCAIESGHEMIVDQPRDGLCRPAMRNRQTERTGRSVITIAGWAT